MKNFCRKKGFTLIELLVVIAIIAILISIIVPSMRAAIKRVHAVICKSNLRQIGMAANFYANDYNNKVPRAAGANQDDLKWFIEFLPYVSQDKAIADYKNIKIYECGSFPKEGTGINQIENKLQTVCYVINGWGDGVTDNPEATSIFDFKSPSTKVYLSDNEAAEWRPIIQTSTDSDIERCDVFKASHLPSYTGTVTDQVNDGRRIPDDRHGRGCNVLYIDWHSENVGPDELYSVNFETD